MAEKYFPNYQGEGVIPCKDAGNAQEKDNDMAPLIEIESSNVELKKGVSDGKKEKSKYVK